MVRDLPDNALQLSGKSARRDRRWVRTRKALIEAFNRLILDRQRGSRPVRVAEIVAEADVGRSTFYDHFRDAEAIHMDALALPFGPLAQAAAGRGDVGKLTHILDHFWENRSQARRSLNGRTGEHAERLLATMVAEQLGDVELALPMNLAAPALARAALAPVKGWLMGDAWCEPSELASAICRSGTAAATALTAKP